MRHILYAVLVVVGFFLIFTASNNILESRRGYASARAEYDRLRGQYLAAPVLRMPARAGEAPEPSPEPPQSPASFTELSVPADASPADLSGLAEINQDFAGWIFIEGAGVDYPVVRGRDNSVYLNTTFSGESNPAGAIFMDYRNAEGFAAPVCILYGHNMRDGSMFARLDMYLDQAFMAAHTRVAVTTEHGEALDYRVFAVKLTDAWDPAYNLSLEDDTAFDGAPEDAARFLLLSTCVGERGSDTRLLVYAYLAE